ncbi:uncharacterized protein N7503_007020 [Penicillium pulvis]|uniref:uncharacterized protein n=1 Tax=Penicillium pulvis TaxID=1562058 RepID=UPI0025477D89|nr:uncharacterized protein N7503_007020 [Penicillium pulvis]KAJ5797724.1 hypothetical protein N7503_007020 [Penicillium pulvis]
MGSENNNYGIQTENNHGNITAEFHPPVRQETQPDPLSTVPFFRDPGFVTRKALDEIHEKNSVPGSRIALVGLGGVGKSQLAIEYTYQVRDRSPSTWIFWVHASSSSRFELSFRDIASRARIPGRDDHDAKIYSVVEDWLQHEKRGKWVMLLDNLDDHELFHTNAAQGQGPSHHATRPLLDYIPRKLNGSVIMTSRSQDIALRFVQDSSLIQVEPMERSEATELLMRKIAFSDEEFSQQNQESLELMEELDDEGIDTMIDFDADHDFEDDVFALRSYSFIHIEDNNLFTMHRLVQLAARVWLVSHDQGEHWKEHFIMRLSKEFPDGNYENWVKCQSLFPHVKAALSQRPESEVSTLEWASLLYRGAWYAFKKGNITDMREMVWNSRRQRIKIMGKEADESLSSTLMLANAYWLEGRYKDAETLELQVVEIHTVKFGENHRHTLISMSNLAAT